MKSTSREWWATHLHRHASAGVTYIRWLEDLRNLFAEQFLSLGEAFQRRIAPALMRTEIDYLSPLRFPDRVMGRM
jgi:acyl-CoA thioesterase FadM